MVRGRLNAAYANELVSFWATRGVLSGEAAQRRLAEVVCVIRRDEKIAGASSAYAAGVGPIGGRRFWIYRSLLDQGAADQWLELVRATFNALHAEFDPKPGSPIGLCMLIADPEERLREPELEWSDPYAIYAGYLSDGRQIRIAYFDDALIAPRPGPVNAVRLWEPGRPLPGNCRIELFAEQDHISAQDVIEMWTREGALAPERARGRAAEVLMVATDAERRPVGVSTTVLERSDRLRAELWNTRVFVAGTHRRSGLATAIAHATMDHLFERYRSGADRRGIGILFRVQSEILKRFFPEAIWPILPFVFIGEDARSHIRVLYFPGARTPEPDQG